MVAAIVFLLPHGAHASAIVTFNFQGVVTHLDVNAGLFGGIGTVNVGDPFTGWVTYEVGVGNPDQLPADPEVGLYQALAFVLDNSAIALVNPRIGIRNRHPIPTLPPPPDPGENVFAILAGATGSVYGGIRLTLSGPFGAAFSDDSLPSDLNLTQFSEATLAGIVAFGLPPLPDVVDAGVITRFDRQTPIPEPSTCILLMTALVLTRRAGILWTPRDVDRRARAGQMASPRKAGG
jgi:hypothetical protein